MRILATADIHGDAAVLAWLVRAVAATGVDALVLAGDLLACPRRYDDVREGHAADAARTVAVLEQVRVPVLFVMGNDDMASLQPESARIRTLHGVRVECSGYGFVGYPYTLPFMGGEFERPEDEIARDLAELEDLVDSRTVLVTHGPAYGHLDVGVLDEHSGSRSLLELVERKRPRAHIHGHIHREFGRDGVHFNVAAAMRRRAVLLDLDRLEHTVVDATTVA